MKKVFFSAIVFSLFSVSLLSANWIVESEVVDDSVDAGLYNSIAVDATGTVHIAYYDADNDDLKHAVQDGSGGWSSGAVDSADDVGSYCSIAVGSSGVPQISYLRSYTQTISNVGTVTRGDLKYAVNSGGGWSLATADNSAGQMGYFTSVAVNSNDEPRVAYHDAAQNNLRYVEKNGSSWGSPVTIENGGKGASLAIDSSGYPHISHVDGTELRYVYWNGSSWISEMVEDYQVKGERTSIALDSNGYPHIVYVNVEGLHYIFWDGTQWIDELVDTGDVGASSPSLVLNSSDEPFISYHSDFGVDGLAVVVAVRNGADDWSMPAWLLEGTTPGGQTSITVGTNDILHVSFHDASTGELGYAKVMKDSDDDWLPDWWEMKYFNDLDEDGDGDPDSDGVNNGDEYENGTDPTVNDGGGSWDRDGDGLGNDDEVNIYGTDPDDPDTDNDGLNDGVEVGYHLFWESFEEPAIDDQWTNGGDQAWTIDSSTAQDESQSVRSGAIGNGQSSYLEREAVLQGEGKISFWYKTSCETNSDYLRFSTNGTTYASYSGSNDWTLTYLEGIPAGTNTFRWTYEKDASGSNGDDAVWIDSVYIGVDAIGTSPTNSDSDADGLLDGEEVNTYGTDPLDADSDDDGLLDGEEISAGSDPHDSDSDNDLMPDGWEVDNSLNPTNSLDAATDIESDGLTNLEEYQNGTNPRVADTDIDGMPDGWEVDNTLMPTNSADAAVDIEPDGLSNLEEYQNGTNPRVADTDIDGMPDGWEVDNTLMPTNSADAAVDIEPDGLSNLEEYQNGTDPRDADSDNDLMPDGWEVMYTLNPTNATDAAVDIEPDGLSNLVEYQNGTNPRNKDTDADGLEDADELNVIGSSPLLQDSDADGLPDGQETSGVGMVGFGFEDGALPTGVVLTGHTNWYVAATDTVQGQYAARSGDMSVDFHYSQLSYTMETAAGMGSFWYSVIVSPNDEFEFFVNGSRKLSTYASPWTNFAFNVSEGTNTFSWKFQTRSGGVRSGNEAALIDQLLLPVAGTGTSPTNSDSDADGLLDGEELNTYNTNPNLADTDSDGLSDGDEVDVYGTLPLNPDTDADGLSDGDEVNTYSTLPLDDDTDNDGLTDGAEVNTYNTLPLDDDTDNDGLLDGEEINTYGTSPLLVDSDEDTLEDGDEVSIYGTRPDLADTDDDGLDDNEEINIYHISPTNPDVDDDGLKDGDEVTVGSDFNNPDSDGDTLSDGDEVHIWGCSPILVDTDSDGMDDNTETVGYTAFTDSFESGSFTNPPWTDVGVIPWVIDAADASNGTNSALLTLAGSGTSGELRLLTSIQSPGKISYSVKCVTGQYQELKLLDLQNGVDLQWFDSTPSWTRITNNLPLGVVHIAWSMEYYSAAEWARIDDIRLFVPATGTDPSKADTDDDGVQDQQELVDGTNPSVADSDSDGLDDGEEKTLGTDPNDADSDNDGLTDGAEVNSYGTLPLDSDTDNDGLPDGEEINTYGSSPLLTDTDGDTLSDYDEVNTYGTRPDLADSDDDGLDDAEEINTYGTLPLDSDTDNDGLSDGDEVNLYNSDPKLPDTDSDGINDNAEVNYWGTRPDLADTDSDGLKDGEEALAYTFTDSFEQQNLAYWWSTAGDPEWQQYYLLSSPDGTNSVYSGIPAQGQTNVLTLTVNTRAGNLEFDIRRGLGGQQNNLELYVDDQWERGYGSNYDWVHESIPVSAGEHTFRWILTRGAADLDYPWALLDLVTVPAAGIGTSPTNSDSDADSLLDGDELNIYGTNPLAADTDNDGLTDDSEINTYGTNPVDPDTDGDGLLDGVEVNTYGTSPLLVDTDGDSLGDGEEVLIYGTDPTLFDSDGDSLSDADEINNYGTLPLDPDTDNDGLSDGREVLSEVVVDSESFEPAEPSAIAGVGVLGTSGSWPAGWYTTGDADWDLVHNVVYDGDAAVRSGCITNGQQSTVQYVFDVTEEGWLSSYVKVSCESPGDELEFLVDGSPVTNYSGELDWTICESFPLSTGVHTFAWSYTKDGSGSAGSDSAWLDLVEFYVAGTGTSPLEDDTDGDFMGDGWEVANDFNPLLPDGSADSDGDGLVNSNEYAVGSNPHKYDSDNDGMPDGWEFDNTLQPTVNDASGDPDNDGLNNLREYEEGSNPHNPDSDGDGLNDGDEVNLYHSSPISSDTDGDGLSDPDEVLTYGTCPHNSDSDYDGLGDKYEVKSGRNILEDSGKHLLNWPYAEGAVEWGDFDGDGDPDLAICGIDASSDSGMCSILRNTDGVFEEEDGEPGGYFGDLAWGDYDKDGDLDIAVSGSISWNYEPYLMYSARISQNTGGAYNSLMNSLVDLTGVVNASVSWGDLNHDGYLDLAISGIREHSINNAWIYTYNPAITNFVRAVTNLNSGVVAWADYNKDGWDDLAVGGTIYRNNGGTLVNIGASTIGVSYGGDIEWGDIDADGDLDVVMSNSGSTRIYRNDGGNSFTPLAQVLPGCNDDTSLGDFDGDGDLDIVIMGCPMRVYLNHTNVFTDAELELPNIYDGGVDWADYDGDGDIDLAVSGRISPQIPTTIHAARLYDNVYVPRAEPLDPDTDDDGVTDGDEVLIFHTNPSNPDTDGDGLSDAFEIFGESVASQSFGSSPLSSGMMLLETMEGGTWSSSGDASWYLDSTVAYDGSSSMRSGSITNGQESVLEYTVNSVTGTISFWINVSSEAGADVLEFAVDGNAVTNWSGSTGWIQATAEITAGVHTFKWTYRKDESGSFGDDAAWLDLVEFYESGWSTDPTNPDTDGDNMWDGWEIENGFNPTYGADGSADADGDLLSNSAEYESHTDPHVKDSDGDGQNDYEEVVITGMSPTNSASVFRIEQMNNSPYGNVLRWTSTDGREYDILQSTNLLNGFLPIQSGIPAGLDGHTEYTNTVPSGPVFYRIKVWNP